MNLIAAADRNWGIGVNGKLLVSIPEDMKYFRRMTTGRTVILGRKTLQTFPQGKPLKDRRNIILSRDPHFAAEGAEIAHSVEEALELCKDVPSEEIFVIGGASIYRALLPYCDTAYITRLDYTYAADAYLPDLDSDEEWEKVSESDEYTYFDLIYTFDVYQRRAVKGN